MKFLIAIVDISFIAAYFLLADYLGPKLVSAGKTWLWWLILFVLMSGFYVSVRWNPINKRAKASTNTAFEAVTFALLLATLFLYDFSVRPVLDKYGIGSAWIVCLLLTFGAIAVGTWKSHRSGRRSNVGSS